MLHLKWTKSDNTRYPDFGFKIMAAFLAANAVILFEEKPNLLFILSNKGFYIASAVSTIFAYLVIELVIGISKWLDQRHPWHAPTKTRPGLQFAFAVLLPIVPLFIAASIYFHLHGINVFDTVYCRRYIPIIGLLLTVLSGYLYYCATNGKNTTAKEKPAKRNLSSVKSLPLPAEQIAYLFASDKNCFVVNFDGLKLGWELTLKESMQLLPATHFCRINRALVINRNAIATIEEVNAKQTRILIKTAIFSKISPAEKASWMLTETSPSFRENSAFKQWYLAEDSALSANHPTPSIEQ